MGREEREKKALRTLKIWEELTGELEGETKGPKPPHIIFTEDW